MRLAARLLALAAGCGGVVALDEHAVSAIGVKSDSSSSEGLTSYVTRLPLPYLYWPRSWTTLNVGIYRALRENCVDVYVIANKNKLVSVPMGGPFIGAHRQELHSFLSIVACC